jgi:L-asparaginase
MQSKPGLIVVLGTGGTIAGTASSAGDSIGYTAAQLGAAQLVAAIPALASVPIEVEQIAQVDSKDMGFEIWGALAIAVESHLARPEVGGVVITHGTDTLEETAYFLQRVLAPAKPVVLVAAMRPATSLQADGPQNLLDAMLVARTRDARGVVAVLGGVVHSALDVRKRHAHRLDAFGSGDAGPIAQVEAGQLRQHRAWPASEGIGLARLPRNGAAWPVVEIVTSHSGAGGATVRALVQAGVHGVAVLRATRCLGGCIVDAQAPALPSAGALTPVQARIELMLQLLVRRVA